MAFLKPVNDQDMATVAINAISKQAINFDKVYGDCANSRYEVNVMIGVKDH